MWLKTLSLLCVALVSRCITPRAIMSCDKIIYVTSVMVSIGSGHRKDVSIHEPASFRKVLHVY